MKFSISTQFLLDLTVSVFFILFSMTFLRFVIPYGFTSKFLLLGSKLIFIALVALIILFLISWFFNKGFKFKKKITFPELKDFLLAILPLSPVISYALINSEYLNFFGLSFLLGTTIIFILIFSFILPIIFSYLASFNILMISGLGLTFIILYMAKISDKHNPGDNFFSASIIYEGLYIFILFTLLYVIYLFKKVIAYTAVVLFTISGVLLNSYNFSVNKLTQIQNKQSDRLVKFLSNEDNKIVKKKNIYILVYESYAGLETLKHYGIDNYHQMDFLQKNGFKVYHGIYSNSAVSIGTTSRILEIEGRISKDGRYYTSGNAFGLNIFKANGYDTIAVFKSPYFFNSSKIKWDKYYPKEDITKLGGKNLTQAIFEGEFRFDIFDDDYDYDKYLELKRKYLNSNKKNTLFYTHNKYPGHSQNSGKCNSNDKKNYIKGINKANKEMQDDVLSIMKNDKNSIIVLLSDHGPYLTKTCSVLGDYNINEIDKYDIQDRYGSFLSIYWPKDILNLKDNIEIVQDIFPAILSNITNNKNLFNDLKVERKFFDRNNIIVGGVNVSNGIIEGGKDDGMPLFDNRSYNLLTLK